MTFAVITKKKYTLIILFFLSLLMFNTSDSISDPDFIEHVIEQDQKKISNNHIDNIINKHQLADDQDFNNSEVSIINNIIEDNKPITNLTPNFHINTKIENFISLKKKKFVIIIDPGHGGIDPGTIGVHYKTYEKTLTLEYAKSLQKKLSKEQYIIYLTRDNDKFISLNNRRYFAKKYKGDLFISLHFNYSDNFDSSGTSIYTLSEKSYNNEAKLLSERENKVDILGNEEIAQDNFGLADLLIDMIRRNTTNSSVKFAKTLLSTLTPRVKVIDNAHRFAGFKVLKGFKTPAVLIEVGYLSNKHEETLVNSSNFKEKFTELLALAIDKYFDDNQK